MKKRRLRIAIDARYLENPTGGISLYLKKLTNEIRRRGDIPILLSTKPLSLKEEGIEYKVIPRLFHWLIWEQVQLALYLFMNHIDLYHAAGNWGIPLVKRTTTILTLHDLIPLEDPAFF